ncbi:MAG: carbon-nitrogen hydrolase family protein [Thermodesulfobacteriota bacterium]
MSPRPERFVAACVQMRSGDDKPRNLEAAEASIEAAARAGATLVVLPETFSWRGPAARDRDEAETLDGPTLARMSEAARRLRLTLVAGSILERCGDGALPFNTSVVLGPDGGRLATYRKLHLFDVSIPGKVEVRESARRGRGDDVVCADTAVGRLGLTVCYDLRFPELYRRLARAGAEVLCVPSAFTFPTGAAHWEVLLRARAIENQCWVLAANQHGPTGQGHADYGHSMIVDPWGTVVACASDGERVVTAEIDLGYLARVRREMPCLEHARLDG